MAHARSRSGATPVLVGQLDLAPLLKPSSVAVLGASQRMNRATRVVANLQRFGYAGPIFPVNPKYDEVLGLKCYADLASTPQPADSVVVAIPAEHIPAALEEAAEAGVRAAVVLSSGFAEAGPAGRERQAALERLAKERGLLICGPNCYGAFNIRLRSATFSGDMPEPLLAGDVALISQSGGFSTMIAERLMPQRGVGFSYLISCGNQAGLTVEDYMEYLVDDQDTQVIGAFVEGFKQPDKLREVAARAAAKRKPLVVMKVGRSENARQATLSHTGVLAGTPQIIEATLKQLGIVQVSSLNEMVETLALMSAAKDYDGGWRVVVTTGSGGECGHAADAADQAGIELPPLSTSTIQKLKRALPDFANPRNPLDGTGAMYENVELFPYMVRTLLEADGFDILAINLNADPPRPNGRAPARGFSRALSAELKNGTHRLVLCFSSAIGGALDGETLKTLAESGIPYLQGTETAMQTITSLRRYRLHLQRRAHASIGTPPRSDGRGSWQGRRGALSTMAARGLLAEFGIPVVETLAAADAEQAVAAAERLGYPVALKIDSPDVAHKSDVGGVRLGCADARSVRDAFEQMLDEVHRHLPAARIDGAVVQPMAAGGVETILGVQIDPLFGPAIVFGLGGIFVEVLGDVSIRVPPISADDALEMICEVRGSALLHGVRGRAPADVGALANAIVSLAALASAHRDSLRALDINPLLVLPQGSGVVAVDWLVELA